MNKVWPLALSGTINKVQVFFPVSHCKQGVALVPVRHREEGMVSVLAANWLHNGILNCIISKEHA